MMINKIFSLGVVTCSLIACSNNDMVSMLPDNRPDYKQSSSINPLEVPPDLTQSTLDDTMVVPELSGGGSASLSDYNSERGGKRLSSKTLEQSLKNIHHSGDATWIELNSKPDVAFQNVLKFWRMNRLPLARVDKNIGIVETEWLEMKSNLPTGGISKFISAALSGLKDNGTRDKFRTRIDYDGKKTYVYITHYGAEEKVITENLANKNGNKDIPDYAWLATSRNPELEAEMLRRLNLYLLRTGKISGKSSPAVSQKTKSSVKLTQLNDGTPALVIGARFDDAWNLLGIAIDRAGFEVNRQNRRGGTYDFAKVTDEETGFIIKNVVRKIEPYSISMADQGNTQIAVMRTRNNQPISATDAQKILTLIAEKIQF